MILTRRKLLRAAGFAAPAIIMSRAQAQLESCLPGFCGRTVSGPVNPCGFAPPSQVTNVIGWWDASCAASITTTGTPFAVAAIADGSGNSNDMTKFGSSNWPQYSTTMFNTSHPGILITATDLCALSCPNPFPMGTGNTLTAWYVGTLARSTSGSGGRTLSYSAPGRLDFDNAGSWTVVTNVSTTLTNFFRNNVGVPSNTGTVYPAGHRFILTIDSSGIMTSYLDGIASATSTSPGNWVTGGSMFFGAEASFASGAIWSGIVGEWGVATDFTNFTNVTALDLALKAKWGL